MSSTSDEPPIDATRMSCIDYRKAAKASEEAFNAWHIPIMLQRIADNEEADWRADFPLLECPTEAEILAAMIPHIPGETKYFFYSSFQAESLTLAFKALHFPNHLHFSEMWEDKSWAEIHENAPYGFTFAIRASAVLARKVEGQAVVILPPGNGGEKTWRVTSLWNWEMDIMMRNPKVTSILRVDMDNNQSEMKTFNVDFSDDAANPTQQYLNYISSIGIELEEDVVNDLKKIGGC